MGKIIIIIFLVLSLTATVTVNHVYAEVELGGQTEAEISSELSTEDASVHEKFMKKLSEEKVADNYDFEALPGKAELSYRLQNNGTLAYVFVDNEEFKMMSDYATNLVSKNIIRGAEVTPFERIGESPCLIIQGSKSGVAKILETLRSIKNTQVPSVMVSIGTNLRRIYIVDYQDIGLTLGAIVTGFWGRVGVESQDSLNPSSYSYSLDNAWQAIFTLNGQLTLNDSNSKSMVLIASELVTPNGQKTELINTDNVAVVTENGSNYSMLTRPVVSSLKIVPSIIRYDVNNPANSDVLLDVITEISVIVGEERVGNSSQPIYTTERLTTKRVVKANNEPIIAGLLISDNKMNARTGLPILGELPIFNEVTAANTKKKSYSLAVLSLAVKLLPDEN